MMRRTSLEDEYDWYIQQASNPENPPEVREVWQQLADGLAPRIDLSSTREEGLW
jgi:hypothetical protein